MTVRLPPDIEALVVSRVSGDEFSSSEEVAIRAKIAEGDLDASDFSPSAVREHLDRVAASLSGETLVPR